MMPLMVPKWKYAYQQIAAKKRRTTTKRRWKNEVDSNCQALMILEEINAYLAKVSPKASG